VQVVGRGRGVPRRNDDDAGYDGVQAEIDEADQAAGQQLIKHDARPAPLHGAGQFSASRR
jgi:hypothetical protein